MPRRALLLLMAFTSSAICASAQEEPAKELIEGFKRERGDLEKRHNDKKKDDRRAAEELKKLTNSAGRPFAQADVLEKKLEDIAKRRTNVEAIKPADQNSQVARESELKSLGRQDERIREELKSLAQSCDGIRGKAEELDKGTEQLQADRTLLWAEAAKLALRIHGTDRKALFEIDGAYAENFDNQKIEARVLVELFKQKGVALSPKHSIEIIEKGALWLIDDLTKKIPYFMRRAGDKVEAISRRSTETRAAPLKSEDAASDALRLRIQDDLERAMALKKDSAAFLERLRSFGSKHG